MSKLIDLTDQRFGKLVVVEQADSDNHQKSRWKCRCDCGVIKVVSSSHLRRHNIQSCGCLRISHGHTRKRTKSTIYVIWDSMLRRCANKNNTAWKYYGDRGIKVCKRWNKFENFAKDMGDSHIDGHQIDRIDNDGDYCLSNCRWVTSKENNRNRSDNYLITHLGKTQCMSAWAEEFSISQHALRTRIKLGWSIKRALTQPIRKYKKVRI